MATTSMTLSVSLRWWVRPFMFMAWLGGAVALAFIDVDDYCDRAGAFVAEHGIRYRVH